MNPTVRLGRIGGIAIGAHWSLLIGLVLIAELLATSVLPELAPGATVGAYWVAAAIGAVALVVSLLAHELAHSLVARRSGVQVRRITLWLLGGVSELESEPPEPGAELRIAAVGPVTSLLLGGLLLGVAGLVAAAGVPALVLGTLGWLATMNLVLGVFNLLPGSPLDGGRVLHGLIWWSSGDRARATRVATGAGRFLGALLAGFGALMLFYGRWDGLWLILVGWFLAGSAVAERTHALATAQVEGLRAVDAMVPVARPAPEWVSVETLVEQLLAEPTPPRVLPVVGMDGNCVGIVRIADLAAVARQERHVVAVRDIARRLPPQLLVAPDTPIADLLAGPLRAGLATAVVVANGHVTGIVTPETLAAAVELRALRHERQGPVSR